MKTVFICGVLLYLIILFFAYENNINDAERDLKEKRKEKNKIRF